jgi:uncharacterized protein
MRIGVISDTHGLLRPEAVAGLRDADHILHAGDVGDPLILDHLRKLAPVTAIRGNIDRSGACARLPMVEIVELAGQSIYMLHDRNVLYFNPGSAGPRRFSLPISIGFLDIAEDGIKPRLVTID